jgi:hypothetical protein
MVKKAKEGLEVKPVKTIEEIQAENATLRTTIEKITAVTGGDNALARYMGELDKINKKATTSADKIQVVEITDHKNISLWTKLGKRIGPLDRGNAEKAFKTFFDLGIILSTEQPTPAQIEEYKQTDEYKKYAEDLAKSRKRKEKSKKSGQMQKLAEEIAKLTGTTVEAINHVFKASEIKPLAEGRK